MCACILGQCGLSVYALGRWRRKERARKTDNEREREKVSEWQRLHSPRANRVNIAEPHTLFVAPGRQWGLNALNLLTIFSCTELAAQGFYALINAV